MPQISKRKLESYKRSEAVAQECRRQIARKAGIVPFDEVTLSKFVIHWLAATGVKDSYKIPEIPRVRKI